MKRLLILLLSLLVVLAASVPVSAESLKYVVDYPEGYPLGWNKTDTLTIPVLPVMTDFDLTSVGPLPFCVIVSADNELLDLYLDDSTEGLLAGELEFSFDLPELPEEPAPCMRFILLNENLAPIAQGGLEPYQDLSLCSFSPIDASGPLSYTTTTQLFLPAWFHRAGKAVVGYKVPGGTTISPEGSLIPKGKTLELSLPETASTQLPFGNYVLRLSVKGVGEISGELNAGMDSGLVLNDTGYFLSNYCVVDSPDSFSEYSIPFKVYSAELNGVTQNTFDLSLLKIIPYGADLTFNYVELLCETH